MTRRNVANAPHEGSEDTVWLSLLPFVSPVFTVIDTLSGLLGRRPVSR